MPSIKVTGFSGLALGIPEAGEAGCGAEFLIECDQLSPNCRAVFESSKSDGNHPPWVRLPHWRRESAQPSRSVRWIINEVDLSHASVGRCFSGEVFR